MNPGSQEVTQEDNVVTKVKANKSTPEDATLDNDVTLKVTKLTVEPIQSGEKLDFKKLQHLSDMI